VSAIPTPKQYRTLWAPDARALDLVGDRWTLLVVRELSGGPRTLAELEQALAAGSPEHLHALIQRMIANGLLTRRSRGTIAPGVDYALTARGLGLRPVISALVRWGYEWTWTPPRDADRVDIGAILRIAPAILHPPARLRAVAELSVGFDAQRWERYVLTIDQGAATIAQRSDANADVRVSGAEADWIRAIGPGFDRGGLRVEGKHWLATMLLDAISLVDGDHGPPLESP
jgi:DNA-binding HxlR family transcriptional regulator